MGGLCNNLGMIIHDHPTVKFTPQTIMTTAINWFTTAATFRSAFTEKVREDGSIFTACKDDIDISPELKEFIRECHDDELPNEWRYETIVRILDALKEDDISNADPNEMAEGIANNITDIYNHSLFQWYADQPDRVEYIDNAVGEGLINADADIIARLIIGQSECIRSMARRIVERLQEEV